MHICRIYCAGSGLKVSTLVDGPKKVLYAHNKETALIVLYLHFCHLPISQCACLLLQVWLATKQLCLITTANRTQRVFGDFWQNQYIGAEKRPVQALASGLYSHTLTPYSHVSIFHSIHQNSNTPKQLHICQPECLICIEP